MYDKSPGDTVAYHRSMLADRVRTEALERAIAAQVKPGDVVLDLGCGSGVLACFACRAGAQRVYAIEMDEIIGLAQSLCRNNGFADRVVFLEGLSTEVWLPEPVDVIVTETIGNIGLEEGIIGWVLDARRRFLKPGGVIIPKAIELFAAAVELPLVDQDIRDWERFPYGLDFSAGRDLAANNLHWVEVTAADCLSQSVRLTRVDLPAASSDRAEGAGMLAIERPGVCHGLAVWFGADLTETISLTNAPPLQTPSWRHGFFPLAAPIHVEVGDRLVLTLEAVGNGALWRWRINPLRANGATSPGTEQSTFHGQLHSLQSLRRGAPSYRPRLKDRGKIDRFILNQMDGTTKVADIAQQVATHFHEQFQEVTEAKQRVARLSRKYAE